MPAALVADVGSAVVSYRPAAGKEASSGEMAPAAVVRRVIDKELSRVRGRCEQEVYDRPVQGGSEVFEQVALAEDLIVFVTLQAYRLLD